MIRYFSFNIMQRHKGMLQETRENSFRGLIFFIFASLNLNL
jgi:hypothetical protein